MPVARPSHTRQLVLRPFSLCQAVSPDSYTYDPSGDGSVDTSPVSSTAVGWQQRSQEVQVERGQLFSIQNASGDVSTGFTGCEHVQELTCP